MTVHLEKRRRTKQPRAAEHGFLQGALILSAGVMLVKILGAIYKIPLTNMIGEVGMGYFNTAYQLYLPIYTLATAGFPVAVSRLVSEHTVQGNLRGARGIFRRAWCFFLCSGLLGMTIMFVGAGAYAHCTGSPKAVWCIRTLSPTILLCCMMAALRGYYNGLRNMTPTAISQVLEAMGRLIFGLGASYGVLKAACRSYANSGEVFGQRVFSEAEALSEALPYAAAGATFGVTFGAFCSLIYLLIYDRLRTPAALHRNAVSPIKTKKIAQVAIPICGGALIVNLGAMVDAIMMQQLLGTLTDSTLEEIVGSAMMQTLQPTERIPFLYGSFTMAQNLSMLIPSFAQAIGTSALPNVAAAAALHAWTQVRDGVEDVLYWTGALTFPAGLGMAVMAEPILGILYQSRPIGAQLAAHPLRVLAAASVFMTISVPVNSMLQALGKEKITVRLLILGMSAKTAANYMLIGRPEWNITGGAMGTLLCYVLVTTFGIFFLWKSCPVKPRLLRSIWAPMLSAVLCAAAARVIWMGVYTFVGILIGTALAVMGAVAVYGTAMVICSGKKIGKWLENRRGIR